MPVTRISFLKPESEYLDESQLIPSDGVTAKFGLEMDVDNDYDLASLLQIEGGTIDDVTFEVDSKYAKIVGNRLIALKMTEGVKEFSDFTNYIILSAKAKSGTAEARLLVRIYDKPTEIRLIKTEVKDGQTVNLQSSLAINGLEVKPGDSFTLDYEVLPRTAQQCIKLVSFNEYMLLNISRMAVKHELVNERGRTTFTLKEDAYYFAGATFKKGEESNFLVTHIHSKRKTVSAVTTPTVNLQVVQYYATDPKPLDYLVTSLPDGFIYNVGGRIGTIDGGLRIKRDVTGRCLIKDRFYLALENIIKRYALAVICEINPNGVAVMKSGISFTYYFDELLQQNVTYEVEPGKTVSGYTDCHGIAMGIHPFGKTTWSDQKGAEDYSLSDGWKAADDYYHSKTKCDSTSGFRLTSHYHFYNNSVSENKKVNPVKYLKEYQSVWRGLLYSGTESNGSDIVPYWIIPSSKECMDINKNFNRRMMQALAERINIAGGDLLDSSCFWTSSLEKKTLERAVYVKWDSYYGFIEVYADKTEEQYSRPFHRF